MNDGTARHASPFVWRGDSDENARLPRGLPPKKQRGLAARLPLQRPAGEPSRAPIPEPSMRQPRRTAAAARETPQQQRDEGTGGTVALALQQEQRLITT